jgi:hypothetical protein
MDRNSGEEVIDEAVLRVPGRFRNGKAEIRRFEFLTPLIAAMLEKHVLKWLKGYCTEGLCLRVLLNHHVVCSSSFVPSAFTNPAFTS